MWCTRQMKRTPSRTSEIWWKITEWQNIEEKKEKLSELKSRVPLRAISIFFVVRRPSQTAKRNFWDCEYAERMSENNKWPLGCFSCRIRSKNGMLRAMRASTMITSRVEPGARDAKKKQQAERTTRKMSRKFTTLSQWEKFVAPASLLIGLGQSVMDVPFSNAFRSVFFLFFFSLFAFDTIHMLMCSLLLSGIRLAIILYVIQFYTPNALLSLFGHFPWAFLLSYKCWKQGVIFADINFLQ